MDIGRGELAESFAGGEEVGAVAIGVAGDEDSAGGNIPFAVALDEYEAAIGWNRGDAADEGGGRSRRIGLFLAYSQPGTGDESEASEEGGGFQSANRISTSFEDG